MINCPNPECQAANPEGSAQCTSCETFLPHRYLWVVGQAALDQLDKRYSWQHQRVVLDTQPGLPPASPDPVPPYVWPYLMLAPHSLHVPQPYALINDDTGREFLLLDAPAIAPPPGQDKPKLLPSLMEAWPTASPLQQLNWLWQVAGLWPDFIKQQVASSLLLGDCLRVHGSLVRLLELAPDPEPLPLTALGTSWQSLVSPAHPSIQTFLESLCTQLISGEIATPEELVTCLDQAIAETASGYQVDYRLAILTNQGPSRKRNEDACYPASGKTQHHTLGPKSSSGKHPPLLLLVCDGIGGHEGGDVASQLAIATIQEELTPLLEWLTEQPLHDPGTITLAIEQAICTANDKISEHNDRGLRQARDRMGTTLVMALIVGVQIYIAHIGDSRAYRISANGCHQITFDDDVATREVRLGYGFYADVVNRPGSGALVQALGMGSSSALHLVVQRLILDDDIVLLLCSDGLSDYDRVEQFWRSQLLPVLTQKTKPAAAATSLVELANTYNGHDNVTVGVIAGQIQSLKPPTVPAPLLPVQTASPVPTLSKAPAATSQPTLIPPEPKPATPPPKTAGGPWPWLWGLVGLLGAITALTMVFFRERPVAQPSQPASPLPETIKDRLNQDANQVGITDDQLPRPPLTPGSYVQLSQPVTLRAAPDIAEDSANTLGQVPDGAIVQVLTRLDRAGDQTLWVRLKVCDDPVPDSSLRAPALANTEDVRPSSTEAEPASPDLAFPDLNVTPPDSTPLMSGAEGWVMEAQLAPIARAAEERNCSSE